MRDSAGNWQRDAAGRGMQRAVGWSCTPSPVLETRLTNRVHFFGEQPSVTGLADNVCELFKRIYRANTLDFWMNPERMLNGFLPKVWRLPLRSVAAPAGRFDHQAISGAGRKLRQIRQGLLRTVLAN